MQSVISEDSFSDLIAPKLSNIITDKTKELLLSYFDRVYDSLSGLYQFPIELGIIEHYYKKDLKEAAIKYAESKAHNFNPEKGLETGYFGTIVKYFVLQKRASLVKGSDAKSNREYLLSLYKPVFRDEKINQLI